MQQNCNYNLHRRDMPFKLYARGVRKSCDTPRSCKRYASGATAAGARVQHLKRRKAQAAVGEAVLPLETALTPALQGSNASAHDKARATPESNILQTQERTSDIVMIATT